MNRGKENERCKFSYDRKFISTSLISLREQIKTRKKSEEKWKINAIFPKKISTLNNSHVSINFPRESNKIHAPRQIFSKNETKKELNQFSLDFLFNFPKTLLINYFSKLCRKTATNVPAEEEQRVQVSRVRCGARVNPLGARGCRAAPIRAWGRKGRAVGRAGRARRGQRDALFATRTPGKGTDRYWKTRSAGGGAFSFSKGAQLLVSRRGRGSLSVCRGSARHRDGERRIKRIQRRGKFRRAPTNADEEREREERREERDRSRLRSSEGDPVPLC